MLRNIYRIYVPYHGSPNCPHLLLGQYLNSVSVPHNTPGARQNMLLYVLILVLSPNQIYRAPRHVRGF